MPEYKTIARTQLVPPPDAQRANMDEEKMLELVSSIRAMGIMNALIVVPAPPSFYQDHTAENETPESCRARLGEMFIIRAGHRRYIASGEAGLNELPCRVYDDPNFNAVAATIHENSAREEVNAVEEGWYYLEIAQREGVTEADLQRLCCQKLDYIYKRIELVKGDEQIVLAVLRGEMKMAAARELNKCPDESHRRYLLNLALEQGATARVVESWVTQWKMSNTAQVSTPAPRVEGAPADLLPVVLPHCEFCGQDAQQFLLKVIYVCEPELRAIKMGLSQQEKS